EEDVISALVNLGYQRGAAEKAVAAAKNGSEGAAFDVLFRKALASASKEEQPRIDGDGADSISEIPSAARKPYPAISFRARGKLRDRDSLVAALLGILEFDANMTN